MVIPPMQKAPGTLVVKIVKDGEMELSNGSESITLSFSTILHAAELIQDMYKIKQKVPKTVLDRGNMVFNED